MSKNLSYVLVCHIKKYLPNIIKEVNLQYAEVDKCLLDMGPLLPDNIQNKETYMYTLLLEFTRKFITAIEDRCSTYETGKCIKQLFVNYRIAIDKLDPFTNKNYSDEYITDTIRNCEGNHMSFLVPPIEVLEHCIKDDKRKPVQTLVEPSIKCSEYVCAVIVDLINELLNDDSIRRFPVLSELIKEQLVVQMFPIYKKRVDDEIRKIICMEEYYVWTDDSMFLEELKKSISKTNNAC